MSQMSVPSYSHVQMDELADAPAPAATTAPSKAAVWGGRVMSGLPAMFLLVDGAMKLAKPEPVVKGTVELGYPESVIVLLGVVLLASTVLYIVPRTAVLGAILLTAYLGGAVATHLRVGNPMLTHTLFPVFFGALLWGGLCLRDARLRALLPVRSAAETR